MDEEMDLKEIVKCIYQRKHILIYMLIACILIGTFYTFVIKKSAYEIKSQILIDKSDTSIKEFIISKDILKNEDINVEFDSTTKIITVSINSSKKELENSLNEIKNYIETLNTKLEETYSIKTYKIIENPEIPEKVNNIEYIKDIITFILIGIMLYCLYIVIIINMSGITNGYQLDKNLNIRFLGMINLQKGKNKKELCYDIENKKIIEQLKRIQANLELNKENKNVKTILLTGTKKGVGTSFVTKNLAEQYTKLCEKILLIDADTINKTLTKCFLEKEEKGLTNIISTKKIEKCTKETNNPKLFILPNGTYEVEEEIFLKHNISELLNEMKKEYDLILIDATSINESIIPISLANTVDSTILIIESAKTKEEEIIKAKATIENVGGKISGVILNKAI